MDKFKEKNYGEMSQLNIHTIVNNSTYKQELIENIVKSPDFKDDLVKIFGEQVKNNLEKKYIDKHIEIKKLNEEYEDKQSKLEITKKILGDLSNKKEKLLKLNSELLTNVENLKVKKEEYDLYVKEMDNLKNKENEFKIKTHELEDEKNILISQIEDLENKKNELNFDISTDIKSIKDKLEEQKRKEIRIYEISLAKEKEILNEDVSNSNSELKNIQETIGDLNIEKNYLLKSKDELLIIVKKLKNEKEEYNLSFNELEILKREINEIMKNISRVRLENSKLEDEKNILIFQIEDLENKKNELNFDISKDIKNINDDLEEQKNITLKTFKTTMENQKKTLKNELEIKEAELKSVSLEIDKMNLEKENLIASLQNIKNEKKDIFTKEKDLDMLNIKLEVEREEIENDKSRINEIKKEIREDIVKSEKIRFNVLEDSLAEAREEISKYLKQIDRLEKLNKSTFEMRELKKEVEDLKIEKINLEDKILGINDERELKIKILTSEKENLEMINKDLLTENSDIEKEKLELFRFKNNIEAFELTMPELERTKESLITLLEKKNKEIYQLKNEEVSEESKREAIEQTYFNLSDFAENIAENIWLDRLASTLKEVGFVFSKRLLYAFHTSLKIADWSSLSILAGVSGTGKSELPRLYSRYGGINFLPLAVQPNWDSPQSLFGYYNSLEKKFNATSLLKVLYQAQKDVKKSINDYVTIVLLDEMNLAHVELYFSELLSKLELLRGENNGVNLEIDISEDKPYKINLNNSIMWVGTMNEDETTKSLSDKVIDRGNLLSFPKPKKLVSRSKLVELKPFPMLRKSNWNEWKWKEENEKKLSKKLENLRGVVEDINKALDESGRAIGHRVWQSIEGYIKNYPLVLVNLEKEKNSKLDNFIKIAFEDALVQKVMPKLRGLETSGDIRENCLDKIKVIIDKNASGIGKDFDIALNNPYGVFVWSSSSYLENDIDEE